MSGEDAVRLTSAVTSRDVDWCICGGWGVDALIGSQTRDHKDLDVFIERGGLSIVLEQVGGLGYRYAYAWEENLPLDDSGPCAGMDSAFVMEDEGGRILDIHVYALEGAVVIPLWAFHRQWQWRHFACTGSINGIQVTCLMVGAQLELHDGYELPPSHRDDVALLMSMQRGA